jgi:hypothetical protein
VVSIQLFFMLAADFSHLTLILSHCPKVCRLPREENAVVENAVVIVPCTNTTCLIVVAYRTFIFYLSNLSSVSLFFLNDFKCIFMIIL